MKIMVVGGGGREHAVIRKLNENTLVTDIFALPGNGGIAMDATPVAIAATDIPAIVDFAVKNGVEYAVVTPDNPLVLGAVDALEGAGIPCFGPRANAAIIEGSKAFSKRLMKKYGIPTADYEIFDNARKGVVIANSREEAFEAVRSAMEDKKFGKSGETVVIEEFLTGPEVSVLSFTDGKCVVPMVSSMDHKRALDGDKGLNTGGMGTIAPNPFYTPEVAKECMERSSSRRSRR